MVQIDVRLRRGVQLLGTAARAHARPRPADVGARERVRAAVVRVFIPALRPGAGGAMGARRGRGTRGVRVRPRDAGTGERVRGGGARQRGARAEGAGGVGVDDDTGDELGDGDRVDGDAAELVRDDVRDGGVRGDAARRAQAGVRGVRRGGRVRVAVQRDRGGAVRVVRGARDRVLGGFRVRGRGDGDFGGNFGGVRYVHV